LKRKPFLGGEQALKGKGGKGGGNRIRRSYILMLLFAEPNGGLRKNFLKHNYEEVFNSTTCMMMLLECRVQKKQRGVIQVINRDEAPFWQQTVVGASKQKDQERRGREK